MGMRDFFRGDRDHDRSREQWRDDRYPQRYSSGSNADRDRDFSRGQRGPQFYGQSGRADWADQRDAGRNQDDRQRDRYERGDRNAGGWERGRGNDRDAPYHGGFYAGETGRESTYRTEPSAQGDWGRDAQRWEQSSRDQLSRGRDDWRPFEAREQGEHRGRGPKGYQRSDQRIHEEICECLTDDAFVDASDIEIDVQSGIVSLTGTVRSRQEKRRAEDLIEQLSGVKDVNNGLRVESGSAPIGKPQAETSNTPSQSRQGSNEQRTNERTPRH